MSTNTVFKSIDDYSIQSFKAYKSWVFTNSTITQYSSSVNEAIFVHASNPNDPSGVNTSGLSRRALFNSVYNTFYRYGWQPYGTAGGNVEHQRRDMSYRAMVLSIGNDYIGEGIKPGSINLYTDSVAGGATFKDDGFGNLYDTAFTATTYPADSKLMGYWDFNDGFVTSGSLTGIFENRNRIGGQPSALASNVIYTANPSTLGGARLTLTGSAGSYAKVDSYRGINFRSNENFSLSFWVVIPSTQSDTTSTVNYIVAKWDGTGGYPYIIGVLNQTWGTAGDRGKIYAASSDGSAVVSIISTAALNDNALHHIVYKRTNSTYQLYVDGSSNGTVALTNTYGQTHNDAPLTIGAISSKLTNTTWGNGNSGFYGSVDELRIYSGSLSAAEVTTLYTTRPTGTPNVGNVFYTQGLLVFTDLSVNYTNLLKTNTFVLNFKSTVTINENNVMLSLNPNEYNMTFNPTAANVVSDARMDYSPVVTSSLWSPYITTIGLYDDNYQLVAIAKFGKPIKKSNDTPMTIVLRWDS